MWDRVRQAHEAGQIHQAHEAGQIHDTTAGRRMIKEMIRRRRCIQRSQRVAHSLRMCCSESRLNHVAQCSITILALLTVLILFVCVIMIANLNNIPTMTQNVPFSVTTAIVSALWVGVIVCYGCTARVSNCIQYLESDPDEV